MVEEFTTAAVSFGMSDTAQWSATWWLDTIYNEVYAGAIGWAWHDSAGNRSSFQPVFTAWASSTRMACGARRPIRCEPLPTSFAVVEPTRLR